ncbi:putative nuclease HARBI1 [Acropora millepora]|uniref:putative nuclease HARBI1 n=2 Tax=Acropora TaxID=6127 RepID=UPI001CF274DA|nr:putative nuclease HARBI1 [Acropora millepora]
MQDERFCFISGMFTNIVARWPGSTHDSFIFSDSQIGQQLNAQHQSVEDGLLLGDSGYPCKPSLMTPYLNPGTNKQTDFNNAHTRKRVAIEQAFGVWKRRFHLLHSEIRMKPEKVCMMIGACAVLHNIAVLRKEPFYGDAEADDQPDPICYCGPEDGKAIRDHICNTFF